jgi:hypothetical protein
MTIPSSDNRALLAPLVIGVTGHRDLRPEDHEELKKKVRLILRGLQKSYPSTPIVLLSPLAEGSDRLAAEVALEVGARLVVPLPMPQHLYEHDFRSPDSLAEFHRLLARAEHRITIRLLADEKDLTRGGEARNRQYEAVGKYIARESQILIALWDGTDSGKIGGTAQIVRFQLQGIPGQSDCDLQSPELFPVYCIVTPRLRNPNPEGNPYHLESKYPESKGDEKNKKAKAYYDQIFRNLDEFNKDILNGGEALTAKAGESKRELLCDFDEGKLSPGQAQDLARYAVADALAKSVQHHMRSIDFILHSTVFVAFLCFVMFAHLEPHHWPFLAVALLLVICSWALVKYLLPYINVDSKSQDYRAIAEGSRVRFFWHLAGIHRSVADNYLGKQRTELDWIRNGLRGWELETHMTPQAAPSPTIQIPEKERLEKVRELWIDRQIEYFRDSTASKEKKLEKDESDILGCAIVAGLIATSILLARLPRVAAWCCHLDPSIPEGSWLEGQIIATDVCLIMAALLHHSTHQKAYAQHIKQFGRMQAIFAKARELIDQKLQLETEDLAGVQHCLLKLGQEALSENGDWVLLHRERPLELPPP